MNSVDFGQDVFIKKATKDDCEDLFNFLMIDFCKREPLTDALDGTPEDMAEIFKDMVKASLGEPCFTYIVRSKKTNEIVATRMMTVLERPSNNNEDNDKPAPYKSWKANIILKLLMQMEHKAWEILPTTQKIAAGIMISVHQNYARRGIAQKLVEYNLDEIKEAGCEGLMREATAKNSQKLFAKLGYQNLYEVLHTDYKDNGKQVFKCRDGTDRAILVYKPLN
uniref:N-acetyltransferase domain-containing protein n=1 Tax=Panagrolaimus sp. ES5 TaxID=591445 RepID=A0AC34FC24_9BILA